MPKRECGGCAICCKLIACGDLNKPVNTWCSHASPNKGCGIHQERPEACRNFFCAWLQDETIPEEMRPDKSRVVLEMIPDYRLCLAIVEPSRPDAWKHKELLPFFNKLHREGIGIITTTGPGCQHNLLVPQGRTAQEIKEDLGKALRACHGV